MPDQREVPSPPKNMDLYEEFLGLIDVLEKHKIDYAVCGGVAVAIHGYPRFTKDIDILIRKQDLDRVLEVIKERKFTVQSGKIPFGVGGPDEREVYRVLRIDGRDVLVLDLMVVSKGLRPVWNDRELAVWRGKRLKIVSPEGLARMKRVAGRPKDLLDIEQLGLSENEKEKKG